LRAIGISFFQNRARHAKTHSLEKNAFKIFVSGFSIKQFPLSNLQCLQRMKFLPSHRVALRIEAK